MIQYKVDRYFTYPQIEIQYKGTELISIYSSVEGYLIVQKGQIANRDAWKAVNRKIKKKVEALNKEYKDDKFGVIKTFMFMKDMDENGMPDKHPIAYDFVLKVTEELKSEWKIFRKLGPVKYKKYLYLSQEI